MSNSEKTADQMRKEFYEALAAQEAKWAAEREADRKERAAEREAEREAREAEREADRKERAAQEAKWAAEREADREAREAERRRDRVEFDKWMAQVKKRLDQVSEDLAQVSEDLAQVSEDLAQTGREWRAFAAKWKKQMAEIRREWGGFTETEGRIVENEGAAALRDLGEIGGMPIEGVLDNQSVVDGEKVLKPEGGREYDGLILCPAARVLVEFKRRLRRDDVRDFLNEQLQDFPRECSELLNGHALYGAVVGAAVDEGARKLAKNNGLFVVRIPLNRRAVILENTARPRTRK